ncbi:hypothetical protein HMN09_00577500 [Mycena chlorophos]|uniref:Uncharacterized protein n=1 Tax=Mycena chlorophos TaxID=658473 RepID=A0A8H6T4R2_MYCCL|nr:hypothetical protein HMN09_00577500 [Mycena chlorophos]
MFSLPARTTQKMESTELPYAQAHAAAADHQPPHLSVRLLIIAVVVTSTTGSIGHFAPTIPLSAAEVAVVLKLFCFAVISAIHYVFDECQHAQWRATMDSQYLLVVFVCSVYSVLHYPSGVDRLRLGCLVVTDCISFAMIKLLAFGDRKYVPFLSKWAGIPGQESQTDALALDSKLDSEFKSIALPLLRLVVSSLPCTFFLAAVYFLYLY